MITWAEAHERAAARAADIHRELDLPMDRPVDVFAAVEQRGVVLAFRPLGSFSGAYLPGGAPGILLNEAHSRTRQRHTASHELGHHELGHAAEVDADLDSALLDGDTECWPDDEKEAEAFGGWFLMPLDLLLFGLEALGISEPSSPYDVYALSLWLGTSYTATARQLAATRLVDGTVANGWAGIPPQTVKRALAGELAPDDLGHDVWWLDGRRHVEPVEARPGDRLVLLLDENPSTGFSWEFTECSDSIRLLADSYKDHWEPEPVRQGAEDDDEIDGAPHPRCFVLEVAPEAARGKHRLGIIEQRPAGGEIAGDFELLVSVSPALHGAQVSKSDLMLTA